MVRELREGPDAERLGERRASTLANDGTALAARPFHLKLDRM